MDNATASDASVFQDAETSTETDRQARLNRILEIISAILLSLATVGSAWCAYQSARWNGVQAISFSAANGARTESVRMSNEALQLASIDVGMFTQLATAYSEENEFLFNFIMDRFRPEMKPAVEAWIATEPLKNPEAPSSPFAMAEYTSAAQDEADRLLGVAEQSLQDAQAANQNSDNYVLLTVMFASVLFFGGISTKFDMFKIRAALIAFGILIFTAGLVILATYPIY
ncbi:MAG: hypothetical protein P8074_23005 [Anaerolineales bacterium]|jgi:hypothetical protein